MVLGVLMFCAGAWAQEGFDGHGWIQPPSDGDVGDLLTAWRPEAQVPGAVGVEALFEYVDAPVVLIARASDGSRVRSALLDDAIGANIGGHVALHERVAVGVAMPVWFTSAGPAGREGPTVGDLRLSVPVGLVLADEEEGGFGVSVIPQLRAPTGNVARFLGDTGPGGAVLVAPGYRTPTLEIVGNLGAELSAPGTYRNLSLGSSLILGAAARYRVHERVSVGLEGWVHPSLKGATVPGTGTPGEIGVSGRARIVEGLTATLGVATAVTHGAGASPLRVVLGLGWSAGKGPKDADGDGITDDVDACVDAPETVNDWRDADGCPDRLATGRVVVVGPDGAPLAGAEVLVGGEVVGVTDPSGVVALAERTPGPVRLEVADPMGLRRAATVETDLAEGDTEIPVTLGWMPGAVRVRVTDTQGNPVPAEIGWGDPADPSTRAVGEDGEELLVLPPGDWTIAVTAPGFASVRRGVTVSPDAESLLEVEVQMEPARTIVTETAVVILDSIRFEVAKAVITPESMAVLDAVANDLILNPEIGLVEVQGHTDSQGGGRYNRELSQARVDAVVAALIERGVPAERLSPVGFGEDCPVADNATEDGRAANRRVQFFIRDPEPPDGVPCHDGRPGQSAAATLEITRQREE